jgi:hypothetical protein
MKKYPLISISIAVVFLIIVASFTNVVGIQSIESSNNKITAEEVDQKDLLFQTIIDLVNNKEIQQIIQKYQTSRKGFFNPIKKLYGLNYPTITKNQLKKMHSIGLFLSRFISKSKIQSMVQEHQLISPEIQKELSAVIEKDAVLCREVTQILNMGCDCDNEQVSFWGFPILCSILNVLMIIPLILFGFGSSLEALGLWFRLIGLIGYIITMITVPIVYAIIYVGTIFDCKWWFIST